jgi:hypothetical protein
LGGLPMPILEAAARRLVLIAINQLDDRAY